MPSSAQVLAMFAAELAFSEIPPPVVERAKDCIIDTVAAAIFGAAFPWSRAMVKRLHLGRTGESGILAARLAGAGYTGPETVLDGKFGFLDAYCRNGEARLLTAGLKQDWETRRICMKRYACHIFAQIPVQSLRELMAKHVFTGADVAEISVEGGEKLLTHHNIREPGDIMKAQYSVPFCVALALFRDPDDPKSFDASALDDACIRSACRRVTLRARSQEGRTAWGAGITVRLRDGRDFTRDSDSCKGMPDNPFSRVELRQKFMVLTSRLEHAAAAAVFEKLDRLDVQPHCSLTIA